MSRDIREAAFSRSTVDDISQGIDSVDISNDGGGISAAAACDMSLSEGDTISEKNAHHMNKI